MQCIIIAAGLGSRLYGDEYLKPLAPLNGTPLIERVMETIHGVAGCEFIVVTGYRADQISAALERTHQAKGYTIKTVFNPLWKEPNGLSVLAAKPLVNGPFLLSMSDHVFTPGLVRRVLDHSPAPDELLLGVDYRINDNPLVDLDDVTRVATRDGRISDIGKGLSHFDAFDTGLFHATPALFDALASSHSAGDASLSGAVRMLAAENRARVVDIGDEAWIDVDSPEMFAKAAARFD